MCTIPHVDSYMSTCKCSQWECTRAWKDACPHAGESSPHKCESMYMFTFAHTHTPTPLLLGIHWHSIWPRATAALFLSRPGGHCLNCMFALDEPWGLQDGRPGGVGLRCQPARPLMKIIRKCGAGMKGLGSWSLQKEMPPKEDQSVVCSCNKWGRYLIGFCGPGSAASDLCEPR